MCLFVRLEASIPSWFTLTRLSYYDFWFQSWTTITGRCWTSKISWAQCWLFFQFQAPISDVTSPINIMLPFTISKAPLMSYTRRMCWATGNFCFACDLSCVWEVENQILLTWVTPVDRLSIKALILSHKEENHSCALPMRVAAKLSNKPRLINWSRIVNKVLLISTYCSNFSERKCIVVNKTRMRSSCFVK